MQFTPDPLFIYISIWEESDRVTRLVVAWVLPVTRAVTVRDIRDSRSACGTRAGSRYSDGIVPMCRPCQLAGPRS